MAVSSQNYQKNYKKSLYLYWTILTSESQTEMLLWLLSNAFLSVVPFLEQQKQLCLWAEVMPQTGMGKEKVLHPHLDLCRHPFLRTCHVVPQDSEVVNQINSQFRLLVFDDQICRITTYCVWRYVIGNMWFIGQRTDFEPLVQMACSTQTHLKTLKDKVGTLPIPSARYFWVSVN